MEIKQHIMFMILWGVLVGAELDQNDDPYWRKRQHEALLRTNVAYKPNYFNVTNCINTNARMMLESKAEDSRISMLAGMKYNSSCEITNPIDACWRCNPDWRKQRTQLAKCALGFGKSTIGGKGGRMYVVTDLSDDDAVNPKPGTLRHAVIQDEPLWITFARNMQIRLKHELLINSRKTIDGRGVRVVIENGPGIALLYVENVIIHGIQFRNIVTAPGGVIRDSMMHFGHRNQSNGNAVAIYGSQRVWIDHCSFTNCFASFVEALEGSTAITISNTRFAVQNEVLVFGANSKNTLDEKMQVTLAYNHFGEKLVRNMPRCSNGFCHLASNVFTGWRDYAIRGFHNVNILSQGNHYRAPDGDLKFKEVTKREVSLLSSGSWRQERDIYLNGAFFEESGNYLTNNPYDEERLRAMPGIVATVMTRHARPLKCFPNQPC